MGNAATRNDHSTTHRKYDSVGEGSNWTVGGVGGAAPNRNSGRKSNLVATKTTSTVYVTEDAAEASAAVVAAQRQRQTSLWSFGSLSGRLNWSFTSGATTTTTTTRTTSTSGGGGAAGPGALRSSWHNRNKSTRKTLTVTQRRRSQTVWHKPLTNAIFSSHFKESSRNEQFRVEQLIAKGAFGVVFRVSDKTTTKTKTIGTTIATTGTTTTGTTIKQQQQQHQSNCAHKQQQQQQQIATSSSSSSSLALKVLKKSKIIADNSVQQLKDEADIQKLCGHHPFIVQQIDLWQNRRNLHILSEYIPNGELFTKITKFSLDLIRVYLAEIALAIDFLHNAGIIYRDAKPENILLTDNYHIKLIDFGLSKWLKLGATTQTMCGTFQYMGTN